MKFSAGNCYNTIPILQVCHIWIKIGRYQQCLFVSTNCAIVQCGVVHFLPSEAVIIGASLRAAKWGRQKRGGGGGEVDRWSLHGDFDGDSASWHSGASQLKTLQKAPGIDI